MARLRNIVHCFLSSLFQVRPKEILLSIDKKTYYVSIRELLIIFFGNKEVYETVKTEKKLISEFNQQDIIYHYRNEEIGRQHRILNNNNNCL